MNKNRAGYNRAELRVWFAWQRLRRSYFSWFPVLLTSSVPDEVLKNQLECDIFPFGKTLIHRVNHSLLSGPIVFCSYKKHSSYCVIITWDHALFLCVCVFPAFIDCTLT